MFIVVGMVIGLAAVISLMRRWAPNRAPDSVQRRSATLRAGLLVAAAGIGLVLLSTFVVK